MRITNIKHIPYAIQSNIRNSYIGFQDMSCSVVAIFTNQYINNKQIVGYGFNSNGRYSSSGLLSERFIPRLLNAQPDQYTTENGDNIDCTKCFNIMMKNEKPGGHGERCASVGVLDMALWDIVCKMEQKPMYKVLSERYNNNQYDKNIYAYAAGGYYYDESHDNISILQDEMRRYIYDYGYKRVKMKIGGDFIDNDMKRIESVIDVLENKNSSNLKVDANGKFDLNTAIKYGEYLDGYNLFWYEEPCDPLDYMIQHKLCEYFKNSNISFGTGENIFSTIDSLNLIRYAGLRSDKDWLHFDCVLSYGVIEFLQTMNMLCENGWGLRRVIPHGGHQLNIHLSCGLQLGGVEIYPDLFQPFGGIKDNTKINDGYINVNDIDLPGLGLEGKESLYKVLKLLHD